MGALRSLQNSVQQDANSGAHYFENEYPDEGFTQYRSYSSLSPEQTASITPQDNLVRDKTIPVTPYEKGSVESIDEDDAFANFKNVKKVKRLSLEKGKKRTHFRESRNKEDALKSVYRKYPGEYSNILN